MDLAALLDVAYSYRGGIVVALGVIIFFIGMLRIMKLFAENSRWTA